mgnify:CR=1 FL=1
MLAEDLVGGIAEDAGGPGVPADHQTERVALEIPEDALGPAAPADDAAVEIGGDRRGSVCDTVQRGGLFRP